MLPAGGSRRKKPFFSYSEIDRLLQLRCRGVGLAERENVGVVIELYVTGIQQRWEKSSVHGSALLHMRWRDRLGYLHRIPGFQPDVRRHTNRRVSVEIQQASRCRVRQHPTPQRQH